MLAWPDTGAAVQFPSLSLRFLLFAFWQGVPIRIELGPKDMESQSIMLARRDTGAKETVAWTDVTARVPQLLEQIQVQ